MKIKKRTRLPILNNSKDIVLEESNEEQGSKPLCETLRDFDSVIENLESQSPRNGRQISCLNSKLGVTFNFLEDAQSKKAHFYVYCPTCKALKTGKLRVRCHFCKSGAFTVHSDPQNWDDVLEAKRITGTCENNPEFCENVYNSKKKNFLKLNAMVFRF